MDQIDFVRRQAKPFTLAVHHARPGHVQGKPDEQQHITEYRGPQQHFRERFKRLPRCVEIETVHGRAS
jgi:hypothetical protein